MLPDLIHPTADGIRLWLSECILPAAHKLIGKERLEEVAASKSRKQSKIKQLEKELAEVQQALLKAVANENFEEAAKYKKK